MNNSKINIAQFTRLKSQCFFILLSCILIVLNACVNNTEDKRNNTCNEQCIVSFEKADNVFPLVTNKSATSILVDVNSDKGIKRVLNLFQDDIEKVTSAHIPLCNEVSKDAEKIVIVGEVDNCQFLKALEEENKISFDEIRGKWENSLIQTVESPFPGINKALVVAGSDKRGVIYGLFELSKQMGVSPWYWWADVPVQKHSEIYVKEGRFNFGEPKVQYRGIFINDEEPALGPWARENFGGFNAQFYDKVFELILRMKGNYLWPAMWGKAFADDDPMNAVLADEYGVVIGYSHHEPMMRAHKEWKKYGSGAWNYNTNKENLQSFWREGIKRNLGKESIITVGMRGDGDEPMSEESNIELLTQIVDDQRKIIEEETGKPAFETPQVWALYKEVQEYYDKGMRVDDDIMLLYCDDNWGNVRRLPGDKERARKGGCGLYYHFDYVGGPRSYKWINTNPLPKIWEQNKLAYDYGVDKLWVVNVGDIKPMELPTQFYLDLAWNPVQMGTEELAAYSKKWAQQQFGEKYAGEIASILNKYGKYAGRRKPEQLDKNTYSLTNYGEYERVSNELKTLSNDVAEVERSLSKAYKDAFFQLVKYPVDALANLYSMYNAQAKNHLYFNQGRSMTNLMADSVEYFFKRDSLLKYHYHHNIANGKWNHMMAEVKIGYTSWNSPRTEVLPCVKRLVVKEDVVPAIYTEGSEEEIKDNIGVLPEFDSFGMQTHYFELFNKGYKAFKYSLKPSQDWIKASSYEGEVIDQKRIQISIDWTKVPTGSTRETIEVASGNKQFVLKVNTFGVEDTKIKGHAESNGYIAIESTDFSKKYTSKNIEWLIIPDIGLTGDGVTAKPSLIGEQEPYKSMLEYNVWFKTKGKVKVYAYFSPTLNFIGKEGLKYGLSFNDEAPEIVNVHHKKHYSWSRIVSDNINVCVSEHEIKEVGNQKLKYHLISPGLVLQKIVIDTGGLKKSKLGPM